MAGGDWYLDAHPDESVVRAALACQRGGAADEPPHDVVVAFVAAARRQIVSWSDATFGSGLGYEVSGLDGNSVLDACVAESGRCKCGDDDQETTGRGKQHRAVSDRVAEKPSDGCADDNHGAVD